MAIPNYTQAEAEWLISLDKVGEFEGRLYDAAARFRPGYSHAAFEIVPLIAQNPVVRFLVRTEANLEIGAYCILLEGSIGERPLEGLCRYDVHDSVHTNRCRCCAPPPEIWPGHFHAHIYNECTIRRGNSWDRCGTLLSIDEDEFKREIRQLIGNFIDDMKLTFSDSETQGSLFQTGIP